MCYGDGASRAGARTLGSGDADAAREASFADEYETAAEFKEAWASRGALFVLPHITNAFKLCRWVTGETPADGYYAEDGWWLVSLAGKGPVTWAVYDDGGT